MWNHHLARTSRVKYWIKFTSPIPRYINLARSRAGRRDLGFEREKIDSATSARNRASSNGRCIANRIWPRKRWRSTLLQRLSRGSVGTVRDPYLPSWKNRSIDLLEFAPIFSRLDASSGYWQAELNVEDRHKTAFTAFHALDGLSLCSLGLQRPLRGSNTLWTL